VPVRQLDRVGEAPFERDVAVFVDALELANGGELVPLAIFDGVVARIADRDFREAGLDDAVYFEPVAEIAQRICGGYG